MQPTYKLRIIPDLIALELGESRCLRVNRDPTHLLSWHSSNPAVVSVTPVGVLQAQSIGTAVLTVSDANDQAEARVFVKQAYVCKSNPASAGAGASYGLDLI